MKDSRAVSAIIEELKNLYPNASCSLDFDPDKAYELLFSVRLAAQCTDARVNLVTPILYAKYPTLEALAAATEEEVGEIIHSTGFWRAKARDIVAASKMLVEEYGGRVPDNMEDLLRLPGVGRKTANLMLGDLYNAPGAVVADTHCIRISGRLGLTDGTKDPGKVEIQLRKILPPEESVNCHCICQPVVSEDILGLPLEERQRLQQEAIDKMDDDWERELDARNKAKAGISEE